MPRTNGSRTKPRRSKCPYPNTTCLGLPYRCLPNGQGWLKSGGLSRAASIPVPFVVSIWRIEAPTSADHRGGVAGWVGGSGLITAAFHLRGRMASDGSSLQTNKSRFAVRSDIDEQDQPGPGRVGGGGGGWELGGGRFYFRNKAGRRMNMNSSSSNGSWAKGPASSAGVGSCVYILQVWGLHFEKKSPSKHAPCSLAFLVRQHVHRVASGASFLMLRINPLVEH